MSGQDFKDGCLIIAVSIFTFAAVLCMSLNAIGVAIEKLKGKP